MVRVSSAYDYAAKALVEMEKGLSAQTDSPRLPPRLPRLPRLPNLRLKAGDVRRPPAMGAVPDTGVLSGLFSVEEALARAAVRSRPGVKEGSPSDYDPVLRSHCRLDREG